MKERRESLERALEEAVSRALRDNLGPLQRTADELQLAYADLIAACSSSKPSNALPAMLRAQTAASALAAGLSVLSNFVAIALSPRRDAESEGQPASAVVELDETVAASPASDTEEEGAGLSAEPEPRVRTKTGKATADHEPQIETTAPEPEMVAVPEIKIPAAAAVREASIAEAPMFDLKNFPTEIQDLHRRANRIAKVAMQDIKLLRPKDVQLGREHNDICDRLRSDLDKARKEYDRRFQAIQDHPVDYFHRWMLEILAGGRIEALGEYPYPSPAPRH